MNNILEKMRLYNAKNDELTKEEQGVIYNVTCSLEAQINEKEKEKEHASESRIQTLDRQIENLKSDIKYRKQDIIKLYEDRKKKISLEFLNQILELVKLLNEKARELKKVNEDKLPEIKKAILLSVDKNDFDKTSSLSLEAKNCAIEITKYDNTLEEISGLENLIITSLNNDAITNSEIIALLNKLQYNLINIGSVLGFSPEVPSTGFKPPIRRESTEQIKKVENAIEVARKSLDEHDALKASSLIDALPDGEEKEKFKKEIEEITALMGQKNAFKIANSLIEKAEKQVSKKLWEDTKENIDALPDGEEKEKLKARIQKLYDENDNIVISLLEELENEVKNNEDITDAKFYELIERYEIMINSSLYVVNDNDLENRIKEVIMYKNAIVQAERQANDAVNNPEKTGLKARFLEFFGFPVNAVCRSKLYGKILKKKKEKAESKNNDKLVQKYEQRSKDRDIISGVRLYQSKDKLSRLKTKLYTDGLSKYDFKAYNKSSNSVSNRLYSGIVRAFKKEYDLIINDRTRTISYADQAMEMLAVQNVDDNDDRFSKIKKFLNIPTSEEKFNSRVEGVTKFLDNAKDANTLTEEEVLAYKEEIDNIVYYKNIYSNNSCKYVDSDVQEIINNKNSSLPYIKTI